MNFEKKITKKRIMKVHLSLYNCLKYLLYVDCFFILACALLNYAEDDCKIEQCAEAEENRKDIGDDFKDQVINYFELAGKNIII